VPGDERVCLRRSEQLVKQARRLNASWIQRPKELPPPTRVAFVTTSVHQSIHPDYLRCTRQSTRGSQITAIQFMKTLVGIQDQVVKRLVMRDRVEDAPHGAAAVLGARDRELALVSVRPSESRSTSASAF
jgi:hypothetical protein